MKTLKQIIDEVVNEKTENDFDKYPHIYDIIKEVNKRWLQQKRQELIEWENKAGESLGSYIYDELLEEIELEKGEKTIGSY